MRGGATVEAHLAVVLPWTGRCTKVAVGQAWFIRSMERFREIRLDAGDE